MRLLVAFLRQFEVTAGFAVVVLVQQCSGCIAYHGQQDEQSTMGPFWFCNRPLHTPRPSLVTRQICISTLGHCSNQGRLDLVFSQDLQ